MRVEFGSKSEERCFGARRRARILAVGEVLGADARARGAMSCELYAMSYFQGGVYGAMISMFVDGIPSLTGYSARCLAGTRSKAIDAVIVALEELIQDPIFLMNIRAR